MIDYFKIASDICRKDAERIRRGEPLVPVDYVPLARAMICIACEAISVIGVTCPACASEQVMSLATWLFSAVKEQPA